VATEAIRFCETLDGLKIAYSVYGEGRPALVITSWNYNLDSLRHPASGSILRRVSEDRLLVSFDRRGIGASQRELGELSIDAALRDVDAVVEAAGLERFDVLGFRDGTALAAAYAVRNPTRVRRMVLVSLFRSIAALARPEAIQGLAEFAGRSWPGAVRAITAWGVRGAPAEDLPWVMENFRRSVSQDACQKYLRFVSTLDCSVLLPQISAPALVVQWRDDPNYPLAEGRSAAALIADARLVVIEGSAPGWSNTDTAAAAILDFLRDGEQGEQPAGLTEREVEILTLLAAARSNQEIARDLSISTRTAERHIGNIYLKIGAHNRAEATAYAIRNGLGPFA
jgi:pimeloyl-ACP methyl ester carboxylesterase/DNA-binding CsgD family transcriptional regulator